MSSGLKIAGSLRELIEVPQWLSDRPTDGGRVQGEKGGVWISRDPHTPPRGYPPHPPLT